MGGNSGGYSVPVPDTGTGPPQLMTAGAGIVEASLFLYLMLAYTLPC
jgi:hypothetical protein